MQVDRDLGVTAMAIIETHPERHNQEQWRIEYDGRPVEDFPDDPLNEGCGTAACMAGWVALLDRVKWATNHIHPWLYYGDKVADPDSCTCPPERRFCTCGNHISVSAYARQRLGLDPAGADALFDPENTTNDLRAGVKAMVNGENVEDAVHRSHSEHDNTRCKECFPEDDDD